MFNKGDKVKVNDNCHCPSWVGQKRIVTMVLQEKGCVFATKMNGTDEHLFRFNEIDLLNKTDSN